MASRPGDAHRLIRWLWTSRRLDARLARAGLLPLAGLWRAGVGLRNLAYDRGWAAVRRLPAPAVAVGNLSVGGSGKTPVASWIAAHYLQRGVVPGILLRGYGRDEVLLHQHATPDARVVANPDRVAGARMALQDGARILVLDDAFQRRDTGRDLNLLLYSAESARTVPWCLPAGPWREPIRAARRATGLIVTRRRAGPDVARAVVEQLGSLVPGPVAILHLTLRRFRGLVSDRRVSPGELAGKRVVAACAIADPGAFIAQVKALGAQVQPATWPDHHDFRDQDLAWLAGASRKVDYLVVTEKDAVKLRGRWPASVPEPLVASLDLVWEAGEGEIVAALDALLPLGPNGVRLKGAST